ncbi:MAG: hypothetical protein H6Q89_1424 [Myxococcaceae bacterium]|nr:hypothetical protein [Myxococcaceae bacterium]
MRAFLFSGVLALSSCAPSLEGLHGDCSSSMKANEPDPSKCAFGQRCVSGGGFTGEAIFRCEILCPNGAADCPAGLGCASEMSDRLNAPVCL